MDIDYQRNIILTCELLLEQTYQSLLILGMVVYWHQWYIFFQNAVFTSDDDTDDEVMELFEKIRKFCHDLDSDWYKITTPMAVLGVQGCSQAVQETQFRTSFIHFIHD